MDEGDLDETRDEDDESTSTKRRRRRKKKVQKTKKVTLQNVRGLFENGIKRYFGISVSIF